MHVLLPQHYRVTIALLNCPKRQSTPCWELFHLLHCNVIGSLLPESLWVLPSAKVWLWLPYNFRVYGSHKNPGSDFLMSWALRAAQNSHLKRNIVPSRGSPWGWRSSDLQNTSKGPRKLVQLSFGISTKNHIISQDQLQFQRTGA